ncbi:MAG: hypothetical protein ACR2PF_17250 [Rhizobiaceae bacterium]
MRSPITSLVLPGTVLLLLAAGPGLAQSKLGQQKRTGPIKWPECYCTDRYGKRHELGDTICMTVGDRTYEAKCVMAQNNPFWRDQERGCVVGGAPLTPFPNRVAFAE